MDEKIKSYIEEDIKSVNQMFSTGEQIHMVKEALFDLIKSHKRDIIVAAGSTLITSYIYHKYGYRICRDRISISLEGKDIEDIGFYGHVSTEMMNFSIKDLGRFGKEMIKRYPKIIDEKSLISRATLSYDLVRKHRK